MFPGSLTPPSPHLGHTIVPYTLIIHMDVMNKQLEECTKQTGYVWGQYPRFAMSTLTPEEIASFNMTAEQARNFRMMVIHVPFGVGIYTGGVSVWIAMGSISWGDK